MKHIYKLSLLALLLSSCGGQMYKTFKTAELNHFKEDSCHQYDLSTGKLYNFRLAQVYETEVISGETFGNKNIPKVYQEVPVKTYANVSDPNFRFPNTMQEDIVNNSIGQEQIWDNIVLWLEDDLNYTNSGKAIYMTTKRVYPTRNHREFNLQRKIGRKQKRFDIKEAKGKATKDATKNPYKKLIALKKTHEDRDRIKERSFFIRKKIANSDSLDFTMMDTFYLGSWCTSKNSEGKTEIQINLAANKDEATTWFEIKAIKGENGTLQFKSVSNNVVDLLSVRNNLEKEMILIDDVMRIENGGMCFEPTPKRVEYITNYQRRLGHIGYTSRFRIPTDKPRIEIEKISVYHCSKKPHKQKLVLHGKENADKHELNKSKHRMKLMGCTINKPLPQSNSHK